MTPQDKTIREIRDDMIEDALAGKNGDVARSLAVCCRELQKDLDGMLRVLERRDDESPIDTANRNAYAIAMMNTDLNRVERERDEARAKLKIVNTDLRLICEARADTLIAELDTLIAELNKKDTPIDKYCRDCAHPICTGRTVHPDNTESCYVGQSSGIEEVK